MDIAELIRRIGDTVATTATVKSVYGEPVTSGHRTVIPVASVRCAFGGGGGAGRHGEEPQRGGGGGGGRISAHPCGVVEITAEGTRFVYFDEPARLAAAVAIGLVAGFALGLLARIGRRKSL